MKKAIVIGGTSGIGRALTEKLIENDWLVGVTGRRVEMLAEIKSKAKSRVFTLVHDITEVQTSDNKLQVLFDQLETVDLVIVSSGIGDSNPDLSWEIENKTIQTNVNGIAKVYDFVFSKFRQQGQGHLVGISSIASLRGSRYSPAYSASKAFQANYLEAMRCYAKKGKLNIQVTDVQPGFVDTPMAKGDGLFWVAPPQKAANQIYRAILKGKRKVYVTKRWRLFAWLLKLVPSWLFERL